MNLFKTLLILLFISANSAQAQTNRLNIGLELGGNLSFFRDKTNYGQWQYSATSNVGYTAGLAFQINLSSHLSLQTGVIYDQKKYSFKNTYFHSDPYTIETATRKTANKFEYITLPLLVRATFGEKVHFFVNAGAFVSVLTSQYTSFESESSSQHTGGSYNTSQEKGTFSDLDDYKRLDYGLVGGIGIGIPIKKRWYLTAELRDNLGFCDIRLDKTGFFNESSLKTNSMGLIVGISYKLGFREEEK